MFRRVLLAAAVLVCSAAVAQSSAAVHAFVAAGDHFELDGKPFQVISGEMHYERIPREYWRARLQMARAMGLNTITTYTFWNKHEPFPDVYDFTGQNDVAEFIREAQQEGLYVFLRPGPYICAEWEFGGYPAWLLRDPAMVVRGRNAAYLRASGEYLKRLGEQLAPLQLAYGGPILAVQVENEYGSFGDDHAYMEAVKQQILDAGFDKALLYTADGPEMIAKGSLPELPAAINFGEGDAKQSFETLKKARPNGPRMAGEYWAGWFDHWDAPHAHTNTQQQASEIAWMLQQGYSVSIYMFHGGTSFGWMNGANIDHEQYQPDVTSYDYDAPLDESGHATAKYFAIRDAIAKATGRTPPAVPAVPALVAMPEFTLQKSSPLLGELPPPVASEQPIAMEQLGQSYGYVLYRTTLGRAVTGVIAAEGLQDYAQVYCDGRMMGVLDRRTATESLRGSCGKGSTLEFLVENTGRVNYGPKLRDNRVGIAKITADGGTLRRWQNYSLPLNATSTRVYSRQECSGACLFRGNFSIETPADTYLDTSSVTKGFVWVNGRALGRAWAIGPQKSLYLPGAWLRAGKNEIVVLDLDAKGAPTLRGLDHPVLDSVTH